VFDTKHIERNRSIRSLNYAVVAHDSVLRLRELMALPSLEQVFKKVVLAADVDEVARDLVGVMRL